MKLNLMLMGLAAPLLLSAFGPQAAAQSLTADEARAAVEARNVIFMETFASGDAAAMAQLYTPDGQLIPPGPPTASGREALTIAIQGMIDSGIARADLTTDEVYPSDNGTITELGHVELFLADGSAAGTGRYIVIWKHSDGEWRLHRDIYVVDTPAAP